MHSSLSLAVGYKEVVTHGRRSCNNVVAILARIRFPRCSEARCRTPAFILSLAALTGYPSWGAAFALRPLRVARDLKRCDHDCLGAPGTLRTGQPTTPPRARRTDFSHRVGASMANGLRPLYCPWPRCFVYHTIPFGAALALPCCALRGISGGATMTYRSPGRFLVSPSSPARVHSYVH